MQADWIWEASVLCIVFLYGLQLSEMACDFQILGRFKKSLLIKLPYDYDQNTTVYQQSTVPKLVQMPKYA